MFLSFVGFLGFLVPMAMSQTVSIKPIDFPGLEITPATDPSAQGWVIAALGANPPLEATSLLPYSVVVFNKTPHTICAYTLHLTFVDVNGKSGGLNRQYFNFERVSNGVEIPPGVPQLVGPIASVRAAPGQEALARSSAAFAQSPGPDSLSAGLLSQAAVVVSIDLIAFDTGSVIGPNEANTLSYLEGYLLGEREAAEVVRHGLTTGEPINTIADELENFISRCPAPSGPNKSFDGLGRANQAKRLLRLANSSSAEELIKEANRILEKPILILHQ